VSGAWSLSGYVAGVRSLPDRLLVDLDDDGQAEVLVWPDKGLPELVSRAPLEWPLDADALGDLRWYLEDYLQAPFGVWEDRGPAIQAQLAGWGDLVFGSVFGPGLARDAYQRARDRGLEIVFRSAEPGLLALPWELMRDGTGPVALRAGGISRSMPVAGGAGTLEVPGGKLRVLVVISRPAGTSDVGYRMVARPLLERLDAVRGEVDLTVLRPPTFDALRRAVKRAADDGEPFHVVHFDGHGVMPGQVGGGSVTGGRPGMMTGPGEGMLAFEEPGVGSDHVGASKIAAVLAEGRVPVVVLNACQSGAVGKDLEASVATALLKAGCAAVVAMAYSVYAIAAAEFMAAFYEFLFTGASVGQAVTAGRERLFERDGRPSPRGDMPLADWLVPVHYLRKEVRFPQARIAQPAAATSLDAALDEIAAAPSGSAAQDPLGAVEGLFVGRDDLFYQLESAVRLQRVVVLTGPGGTGKTELAKGFARWWRDTGGVDDARLVFWHSFEPGVASFGLDGVISGLGLEVLSAGFARLDLPERLDAVKRLLGQYRGLLVWDNFESVRELPDPDGATQPLDDAGCAQLREFLEWVRDHSRSVVIITSRAQEGWLGQRRIQVGRLNRQEAAEYAGHLLAPYSAAQAQRERRPFGELLEWLDGHPLAMRLTLPRLNSTDLPDLLAGLRGTIPLPAEDDPGADRTTSLPASITYSYTHLAEQTRRLLPMVSLFHGVADEDVLAAFSTVKGVPARFAGVSKREWTAVLKDAVRTGLLTLLGWGMYQIHPALPSYLAAGWRAEDPAGYNEERQACERAFCAACAAFGRSLATQIIFGSGAAPIIAIIGLQRRTLGAMLGHALEYHAWDEATGIVTALDPYWQTRGLSEEATAWTDRILAATTAPGRDTPATDTSAIELWLSTTIRRADWKKDAGQLDQAEQSYRHVLAYVQNQPETLSTRICMSCIFHQLGMIAQDRGRLDEADDWYRKSLVIDEALGDQHGVAISYHQLGITARFRGRLDEADEWQRKALTIQEDLGDRPRLSDTYHDLGITAVARGRLDEADDWHRKALTIQEDLGDRPRLASSYHDLGNLAWHRERRDDAENWYRKALTIEEDLGDRRSMARTYHQLGIIAHDRGRLDEADDWHRRALTIQEDLGDRPGIAATYHEFGIIALARERLDEADDWDRRVLTIQEDLGDRPGMTRTYMQLGNVARARERLDEADSWYRKALTLEEKLGDRPGVAMSYRQLGRTAQDRGRLDEADDWHRKALTISEELGDRPKMAMTYAQLGLLAEARQQPSQALDWTIRCVTLFGQFPHPATEPGPRYLAQLTRQLGMPTLEQAWRQVTGHPIPQAVRDYLASHSDDHGGES
jgi:tetratricopeptide (TPR) repeat protein